MVLFVQKLRLRPHAALDDALVRRLRRIELERHAADLKTRETPGFRVYPKDHGT